MSETDLQKQLENSKEHNKWMIYLFPFPKFAFITIIVGIFPLLAGIFLLIIGILELPKSIYLFALFLIGLGLTTIGIGAYLIKFGIDLWRESRPFWKFHSTATEEVC